LLARLALAPGHVLLTAFLMVTGLPLMTMLPLHKRAPTPLPLHWLNVPLPKVSARAGGWWCSGSKQTRGCWGGFFSGAGDATSTDGC
jgi:hypothetical protein